MEATPTLVDQRFDDPRSFEFDPRSIAPHVPTARDLFAEANQAAFFARVAAPEVVETAEPVDAHRARLGSHIGFVGVAPHISTGVEGVVSEVLYGMGARDNRQVAKVGAYALAA